MRTYGQFCPVARTSELLAERWTPIIIRNLLNGCRTFTEIRQGAPGIPTALLTKRLNTLERNGVVARQRGPSGRGRTYRLTEQGQDLRAVCEAAFCWLSVLRRWRPGTAPRWWPGSGRGRSPRCRGCWPTPGPHRSAAGQLTSALSGVPARGPPCGRAR